MPEEIVLLSFTSIMAATGLLFGLMRSINKHLDRKYRVKAGAPDEQVLAELEDLRSRLEGADHLAERVAELEERLDFAERVLSQEQPKGTLARGE